jgi:hypothetical protein
MLKVMVFVPARLISSTGTSSLLPCHLLVSHVVFQSISDREVLIALIVNSEELQICRQPGPNTAGIPQMSAQGLLTLIPQECCDEKLGLRDALSLYG